MRPYEDRLTMARRHVAQGHLIIERQKQLIGRTRFRGFETDAADDRTPIGV